MDISGFFFPKLEETGIFISQDAECKLSKEFVAAIKPWCLSGISIRIPKKFCSTFEKEVAKALLDVPPAIGAFDHNEFFRYLVHQLRINYSGTVSSLWGIRDDIDHPEVLEWVRIRKPGSCSTIYLHPIYLTVGTNDPTNTGCVSDLGK